jgi:colicin import membrane protein
MNTTVARPYGVPKSGGSGPAVALAVLVHVLLGVLLFFGVRWQSSPPAVIQAELWSAVPQVAAPPPRPVTPPPQPETPPPQPTVAPEPPQPKADIVEKAPARVEPPKKEPVKVEPAKPQPKPPAPVRKVEPPKQKPEPAKLPPREAPARPPSDLAAIMAAANGPETSTGKDQQTSGPRGSDTYIARLVNAIRSQARYPASSPGNPVVTMRIEQLPNGEVTNVTVTKASGVQAFDEAVERAIRAASPLPRDEHGKVPDRILDLNYYMYDRK